MRIGIATCRPLPEPDLDEPLLLEALRARGHTVRTVAWNDAGDDPGDCDVCVLRSTWDYPERPEAFADWVRRTARVTRLRNPAPVVLDNLHKSYLRGLEERGVPIVPTHWIATGERPDLAGILAAYGWSDVVVKPAVSAGSFRTRRFRDTELEGGQDFLRELARERDVMVQPYIRAVEAGGERALVWIDGELTHAVEKRPRFAGQDEQVSGALEPRDDEREFAGRTLAALEDRAGLLYARVDVFRDDAGALCLSELELIEPSLFLKQSPRALARLADALGR